MKTWKKFTNFMNYFKSQKMMKKKKIKKNYLKKNLEN